MAAVALHLVLLTTTLCGVSLAQTEQDILQYSVTEESPAGHVVGHVFADAGLEADPEIAGQGYLTFTESSSGALSLFAISGGRVLTVGPRLDRDVLCAGEESCVVNVDLKLHPSSFFRIIKVQVTIVDINDNAPEFSDTVISLSVSEAAAIGFKIPIPSATDPDSPAYGIDRYYINDTRGLFELDQTTSPSRFLVLRGRMDREERASYQVQLTAEDRGDPPKSGSTILQINVIDVNDNIPQFDNESYYAIIPEDFPVQLPVITVHAADRDLGDNAQIVYKFDAATDEKYGQYFTVDGSTGTIRVSGALDFETMPSVTLTVTASNPDDPSMSSFTAVHINIGDVNDNAPEMRVQGMTDGNVIYKEETEIFQDFVAHVTVSDPDSGNNGKFDCSLSGREFRLNKLYDTDFVIQTNVALDRERQSEYDVRMICADKGNPRQSSLLDLKIRVADVNDNPPTFSERSYYATVIENNYVGFNIANVQATDPDAGENGTVTYHFGNDVNNILHLDEMTGNISALTRFDRELLPRLEVVVVASDLGTPKSLSATATLVIDIIDQDDNIPEFSAEQYVFYTKESQTIQTFIGKVNASDPDTELFNQFGYFLTYDGGDSEAFTIDRSTGQIYTSRELNRETQTEYKFEVRAVSDGPTLRVSTATVVVRVSDVNDRVPEIVYPTPNNNSVYLSNRVAVGTVIAHVIAHDQDDGPNAELSYFLVSGDNGGYFSLEADGSVVLKKSLDQFDQRAFGLVIMVADNGTPPKSTETYLNVVVNKSISADSRGLMTHQNLTIVIAIATISGLIMVVLIVAIVMLLRCPSLKKSPAQKYNYVARAHHQKAKPDGSYDNPDFDVERSPDSVVKMAAMTEEALAKQQRIMGEEKDDKMADDIHHPGYQFNNITRPLARDSESSTGETDSGRGSHDDVVLDQSPTPAHSDKEHTDGRHFPLLTSLQGNPPRPPPVSPHRGWRDSQRSSPGDPRDMHHHHNIARAYYSNHGNPTDSTRDHQGYGWQSSQMSSEVHV